jgi:5-formyltetrahydrofolate cyclo-ligase
MDEPSIHEIRSEIRKRAMKERDALAPGLRHQESQKIIERLHGYLAGKTVRSIHCYISFRSEVETQAFIKLELREGMRVTVPIVEHTGDRKSLVHTEISGLSNLAIGSFGLQEPVERNPASLDTLDAVMVPLVAFDRHGTRLGYGMGFYDAFLRELPRSVERIGLAFRMQEMNRIPILSHDEPLDTVITEQEIIRIQA